MDPFSIQTIPVAILLSTALGYRGYTKQSLNIGGAIIGTIVGFLLVCTGYRGIVLFIFYQIGSWATKYKQHYKLQYDITSLSQSTTNISTSTNNDNDNKKDKTSRGGRGPYQVLCVSIIATILSLYHAILYGPEQPFHYSTTYLQKSSTVILSSSLLSSLSSWIVVLSPTTLSSAIVAHHATGLADTLASEMGTIFGSSKTSCMSIVVLIIQPWKIVPCGTNGGVTIIGFIWSLIGGCIIGIVTVVIDTYCSTIYPIYTIRTIVYSTICGLIGSIIDSLLGATCQATYYNTITKQIVLKPTNFNNKNATTKDNNNYKIQHICGYDILSNEQVNFVSMLITCIICSTYIAPLIFITV